MKKEALIFFLTLVIFVIGGCDKLDQEGVCSPKTPQSEQAEILAYASANGINATAHSSGVYYQVINQGSGAVPTTGSRVDVKYTGKLLNGTVFDSQTNSSMTGWILGNLIPGWQIGIPLIQKGGYIKLIIPSSLCYGCNGSGPIPANSVLYFEIELTDVQ
jgi:FKBP-type peptidyl-prolyl cis-trans isomerase FkpA